MNFLAKYFRNNRRLSVRLAYLLNRVSVVLQIQSRKIIQLINHDTSDYGSEWFVLGRKELQEKISEILDEQKKNYEHYSYFYDYPYQGLATLGIFGERSTEERFEIYKLKEYLNKDDNILDLGCNCGFLSIYTAFRTGCRVDGIDINPYAIKIGTVCSEFLKLNDRVKLQACRVQDYKLESKYKGIFSFATHWTDDKNYRVKLEDHFNFIADLLDQKGLLFFESHCADVGQEDFYQCIEKISDRFEVLYKTDTDSSSRHYYIFRKIN